MVKILKLMMVSLVVSIFCGGCLFYNNPKVAYYDINNSNNLVIEIDREVNYQQFRNITPVGVNFVYNTKDGVIEIDRENSWIQNPEQMIQRKFFNALKCRQVLEDTENIPQINLYISIFNFEMNKVDKFCRAGINIRMKMYKKGNSYDFEKQYNATVKVNDDIPSAYAVGLSDAVEQIIVEIAEDLKKAPTLN